MEWEYTTDVNVSYIDSYFTKGKSGESPQDKLNKILNEHGKEGWELVSTVLYSKYLLLVFKRPKK